MITYSSSIYVDLHVISKQQVAQLGSYILNLSWCCNSLKSISTIIAGRHQTVLSIQVQQQNEQAVRRLEEMQMKRWVNEAKEVT